MMDKKDIISKLAGYKLEGDIEGREKTIELGYEIMIRLEMSRHSIPVNFSLHTCSYLDNSIIHLSIRDNYGIKF